MRGGLSTSYRIKCNNYEVSKSFLISNSLSLVVQISEGDKALTTKDIKSQLMSNDFLFKQSKSMA